MAFTMRANELRHDPSPQERGGLDALLSWVEPEQGVRTLELAIDDGREGAFVVGDDCAMPFDDGAFDLIMCRSAAHHFRDHSAFFRETARVLASGGRFAFEDHVLPDHTASALFVDSLERLRDSSHVRARTIDGWMTEATAAGLSVERHAVVDQRHVFTEWCASRACDARAVEALVSHARRLPRMAAEWLSPEWSGGRDPHVAIASQPRELVAFNKKHVIMLARKES